MEMTISAARLVADLEALGLPFKQPHHLVDRPHLRTLNNLSRFVKDAHRHPLIVNVESDVQHRNLPRSGDVKPDSVIFTSRSDRGFLHSFTPEQNSGPETRRFAWSSSRPFAHVASR